MLALAALAVTGVAAPSAAAAEPPNVIVVVTDDQAASTASAAVMPALERVIGAGGSRFSRSVVSTPLCCPSRSSFLTGQYGHNNGVLWNAPGYRDLREKRNTLPVWMSRAGYTTAHVGKYLNGYRYAVDDPTEVAPGWDRWHTVLDPTSYYSAPFSVDGRLRESGTVPAEHTTAIINRTVAETIRRDVGPQEPPLFMVVDQFAPHRSGGPSLVDRCAAPGPEPLVADAAAFSGAPLPAGASFNEADAADKPSFISDRAPYDERQIAALSATYGCTLAALRGVDSGIGRIWRALGRSGERRNTMIAFTSDNGFYFGEHRLSFEKTVPYRESHEVPLLIRLPRAAGGERGQVVDELVAGVDLPATILDVAGTEPCRSGRDCRTLDGRSLVPLLTGEDEAWPAGRAIPLEIDTGGKPGFPRTPCDYTGLRTAGEIFLHHTAIAGADGECSPADEYERYDLGSDPGQLTNLLPSGTTPLESALAAELQRRAGKLSRCAGIDGRDARAGSRPFCE